MKIRLIVVGKLKEKYLKQGIAEYQKRLGRYTQFEIIEVKDEPTSENASENEEEQIKAVEGERLLAAIKPRDKVIVLSLDGKMMTSEQFAAEIQTSMTYGQSTIDFVIGGSLGTSEGVNQRADTEVCFGKMTYPHQLMRLILVEQIYRAFRIMNHEPYHK
ncbi:MAG: 23S rRNA (pseudouridine(1915)-N(3))-methyltransferase RlmH [Aerococcus sp.]|nr:23S rRNA (pseudouridine(1915)-N(3))-methyltransferase RlmH [Aerococcus sp.]